MPYLLNLLYVAAILLALPWLLYQRLRNGKYREGLSAKLLGRLPVRRGDAPCIWLHAVSVGEVNLLQPLLLCWQQRHPDWDVVISTTTHAGYQLACRKYAAHMVVYCPLDFTWAVNRAMEAIRPTLLVLAELELWPNLIAAAKRNGAKVAVVNGRLGEKSFRGYRRVGPLVRRILRQIDLIAAQNDEYADRFRQLGAVPRAVAVTGNIKFDGAHTDRSAPDVQRLARLAGIAEGDMVFLAGSTQEPEEAVALSVYQRLIAEFPRLRLILVPRHPERFDEVAALLERRTVPYQRRSQLGRPPAPPTESRPWLQTAAAPPLSSAPHPQSAVPRPPPPVLLIDAVGELGSWWGTAHIAFVGGSLTSRGGQNMIEPAGYGAAVSFGPNTWNFRDIAALLVERQAAAVVRSEQELQAFVRRCLTEPSYAADLGRRAQQLVLAQQGAAKRTVQWLDRLMGETFTSPSPPAAAGLAAPPAAGRRPCGSYSAAASRQTDTRRR